MTDTALYYALSTLAQCAAALAALIGFLSLWRLDYLHEEKEPLDRVIRQNAAGFISQRAQEQGNPLPYFPDPDLNKIDNNRLIAIGPEILNHPSYGNEQQKAIFARWRALTNNEQRLMTVLVLFLVVTLVLTLAPAIVGIVHVEWLKTWPWTPTLLYVAGALLAIAPTCVVVMAARSTRRGLILASLLALASPALAGPVRCQTYPEPTMGPPADLVRRRHARRVDLVADAWPVGHHRHAAAGEDMPGSVQSHDPPVGGALLLAEGRIEADTRVSLCGVYLRLAGP